MRVRLTYDEAVKLIPDGDYIHVFTNGQMALIGQELPREQILQLLRSGKPELSGDGATALGHGICAYRRVDERDRVLADPIFIKTKESRHA